MRRPAADGPPFGCGGSGRAHPARLLLCCCPVHYRKIQVGSITGKSKSGPSQENPSWVHHRKIQVGSAPRTLTQACPLSLRPFFAQALSPFIDPVTKSKVIFIKSAEWRERIGSKRAGSGVQRAEAAANQDAAHVPDGRDFEQYWDVYETSYDEAAYRELLASVGWP
eukprot:365733-Chlamydomonas_euryale.AAC.7